MSLCSHGHDPWLWVCVAIGLIPSLIASFVYCTQRFSKPSESVDELTKIGGVEVSLIDLRRSQMHLRWVITYTCMQLGLMVSVMSVAPILGWGLGLYGWRAVANAFIAATTLPCVHAAGLVSDPPRHFPKGWQEDDGRVVSAPHDKFALRLWGHRHFG